MARTDNQVRTELFKLAIELVDDRAEKEIERLQNDAALGDGTYTVPEDTRVADAQTITRDLFEFYSTILSFIHTVPSSKNSFFQIGTVFFSSSTKNWDASKDSFLCFDFTDKTILSSEG